MRMSNDDGMIGAVNGETFSEQVLERSRQQPILVDFWAAWCNPCQVLMPLLEEIVRSYAGKVLLAKVDTEAEPALAEEYGIRSLPTVKLFRNGRVVEEFMGVQPETEIRDLIEPYIDRPSDQYHQQALTALQGGNIQAARSLLKQAHDIDPDNHYLAIELASLMLQTGEIDEAEALIQALPIKYREEETVRQLLALALFARGRLEAGDIETLEVGVKTDPDDLEKRFQLASSYILNDEYEAGLEQLIAIMQRDREFSDDIGRRGILAVFEIIGEGNELVPRYRRRMASLLH